MTVGQVCSSCGMAKPPEELIVGDDFRLFCEPCLDAAVRAEARRDSIDAAWAAVEAALPNGWHLHQVFAHGPRWEAYAQQASWVGGIATAERVGAGMFADGDTPAKALRALAARLSEVRP